LTVNSLQRNGGIYARIRSEVSDALVERFWSKVDRRGPDECWQWLASLRKSYGQFGSLRNRWKAQAHRFAWEIVHGPIQQGLFVLHRCDNPPCVNPDHLYLGTQGDNMRECTRKGRRQRGDQHWTRRRPELFKTRLTPEKAAEIRAALVESKTSEVAKRFGVSWYVVHNVRTGRRWATK